MKSKGARKNGRTRKPSASAGGAATPASQAIEVGHGTVASATKKKYNAAGRRVNGQWCASDAEATRYEQLLHMQTTGQIDNLRCQVRYPLLVNGVKICTYVADFTYDVINPDARLDRHVIEEVKGLETPEWRMKCKLFEAINAPMKISVIRKSPPMSWLKDNEPALAEQMAGKMSSFSHWITVRWANTVPN